MEIISHVTTSIPQKAEEPSPKTTLNSEKSLFWPSTKIAFIDIVTNAKTVLITDHTSLPETKTTVNTKQTTFMMERWTKRITLHSETSVWPFAKIVPKHLVTNGETVLITDTTSSSETMTTLDTELVKDNVFDYVHNITNSYGEIETLSQTECNLHGNGSTHINADRNCQTNNRSTINRLEGVKTTFWRLDFSIFSYSK